MSPHAMRSSPDGVAAPAAAAGLNPIERLSIGDDGTRLRSCVTFNDHEASTKSYRFTREHHADRALQQKQEIATGLLYIDGSAQDMHGVSRTVDRPLVEIPFEELCPGSAALDALMEEFR